VAKKPNANPVGRPSIRESKKADALRYVMGAWRDVGDVVPSIAGLACFLGVNKDTIHTWALEDSNFSDYSKGIKVLQERSLLNGGLSGDFNSNVCKMMLTKHGYSDRIEQDMTSSDGSMRPAAPVYNIVNK